MSKITTYNHLQNCAEAARDYAASLSAQVATAVSDALTEMEETKADKTTAVAVTIAASGWTAGANTSYPYTYIIAVDGVTTADRANVTLSPDSITTAQACEICPTTETYSGGFYLYAQTIPDSDMSAEYTIDKGAE